MAERSFVDDFVTATQGIIADAQKIGQVLVPPTPAPVQPVRQYPGNGFNLSPYMSIGLMVLAGLLVWKLVK